MPFPFYRTMSVYLTYCGFTILWSAWPFFGYPFYNSCLLSYYYILKISCLKDSSELVLCKRSVTRIMVQHPEFAPRVRRGAAQSDACLVKVYSMSRGSTPYFYQVWKILLGLLPKVVLPYRVCGTK